MLRRSDYDDLQNLLKANTDASEFYKYAQERAESKAMAGLFKDLKTIHDDVVKDISSLLIAEGKAPKIEQSVRGKMREVWAELKANLTSKVDETLVAQLEEAEDRCLEEVQDLMKNESIAFNTRTHITKEHTKLKRSHDIMRNMKKELAAA